MSCRLSLALRLFCFCFVVVLLLLSKAEALRSIVPRYAPKDGTSLGSDIAPKDGRPLESEPVTRKQRKSRSGSNKNENKFEKGNVNDDIRHSNVNDAIRHSHINDAIYRLPAALTLYKHQLAEMSHVLT